MKIEKQNSKTQFEAKPFFGTLGILHTNSVWHGKLTKALQKWQHQGKVKTIGSLKIVENLNIFRSNFAIFAKPRPLCAMLGLQCEVQTDLKEFKKYLYKGEAENRIE